MKRIFNTLSLIAVAVVASACGGGGGSAGTVAAEYSITLKADKEQLPLNIEGKAPGFDGYSGFGVDSPFTTVLHVNATVGVGGPSIPNQGDGTFQCNLGAGLKDNALYYLDGKDEHMVEIEDETGKKRKVPAAFRSITLPANAGGATFHFHAGNEVGTANIDCTVTDPRDNTQKKATVNIAIGGNTGKPASVRMVTAVPGYLGTKENTYGLRNQMVMQAFVMDDANQPTASTSGANVQVEILSEGRWGTSAAQCFDDPLRLGCARLVAGAMSGRQLQLSSVGGVATFSLISGTETGAIFLRLTADRFDNNVANGIQEPITTIQPVAVLEALTSGLAVTDVDLGDVTKDVPVTAFLTATGGLPPYTWSAVGLPKGLAVDGSTGVLSGKADKDAEEREYRATVTVVDKNKFYATAIVKLKLVGGLSEDFAIGNCNSNAVCPIGTASVGSNFTYSFVASTNNVTWTFTGLPAWLTSGTTSSAGVINGRPQVADCGRHSFVVTATKGASKVDRRFEVSVGSGTPPDGADPAAYTCP